MKKLLFVFLLIGAVLSAQEKKLKEPPCITGPTEILVGEDNLFTTSVLAQCTNCHDWDVILGDATIVNPGQDQENTVIIRPNQPGTFKLQLTYLNEGGCYSCTSTFVAVQELNCDLEEDIEGELNCLSSTKTGSVKVDESLDISNIWQIEWIYEEKLNDGYYSGLLFDDSNDYQVASNDPSNYFLEDFTFTGSCRGGFEEYICFRRVIKFYDCEPQYDIVCATIENNTPLVEIFPNPTKDSQNVNFKGLDYKNISEIEIIDIYGNSKKNFKPTKQSFNVDNLNSGIYIVKFITTNNDVIEKKLVVE